MVWQLIFWTKEFIGQMLKQNKLAAVITGEIIFEQFYIHINIYVILFPWQFLKNVFIGLIGIKKVFSLLINFMEEKLKRFFYFYINHFLQNFALCEYNLICGNFKWFELQTSELEIERFTVHSKNPGRSST